MQKAITIAVDAMGGDNAPKEIVKGAVLAVEEKKDIKVILVGKEEVILDELKGYEYDKERIITVNAEDNISNNESPVLAIRRKKNSSIVIALNLVKNGQADAFVSAGSTGAVLAGGQLIIGRIKGVERPPLAPIIPTIARIIID